ATCLARPAAARHECGAAGPPATPRHGCSLFASQAAGAAPGYAPGNESRDEPPKELEPSFNFGKKERSHERETETHTARARSRDRLRRYAARGGAGNTQRDPAGRAAR